MSRGTTIRPSTPRGLVPLPRPVVVLSHLRWDFVYQRPQHLLSRLARRRRVLYVEEPLDAGAAGDAWELLRPAPEVLVARPRLYGLPGRSPEEVETTIAGMLPDLLAAEEVVRPVA